jgi:hypothetical protein
MRDREMAQNHIADVQVRMVNYARRGTAICPYLFTLLFGLEFGIGIDLYTFVQGSFVPLVKLPHVTEARRAVLDWQESFSSRFKIVYYCDHAEIMTGE